MLFLKGRGLLVVRDCDREGCCLILALPRDYAGVMGVSFGQFVT
jgi:hypothetical protein